MKIFNVRRTESGLRRLTMRSLAGIIGLVMLMFGPVSTAEGRVVITEVFVDVPLPDQYFDNGPGLAVTLGEFAAPLDIVAAAPNQIVVDLPFGLVAGDYLLSVRTGGGQNRQDVYSLTIGLQPVPALPTNAIILWGNSNFCPAGFAHVAAFDGKFLMAAATVGVTGGANTHNHGAGSFTGSAHRHNLEPWNGSFPPVDDNAGGTQFNARTDIAGGGTITGTSETVDSRPEFITILLCRRM